MRHKGVEYTVLQTVERGVWKWRFELGHRTRMGETRQGGRAAAILRAQAAIDVALAIAHKRSAVVPKMDIS